MKRSKIKMITKLKKLYFDFTIHYLTKVIKLVWCWEYISIEYNTMSKDRIALIRSIAFRL